MASELEVGKIVAESGIVGTGTAVVTTAKPTLAITDTSVGGSVTVRGQSPVLAFDVTSSGTGTILTDGGGLNVKDGTLDGHGNTLLAIDSTGLATFASDLNANDGYFRAGCTASPNASVEGFAIRGRTSENRSSSGSATTSYGHLAFWNGNGQVGYIATSGSTTTYSTSSDYRLKENLTPLTGALDRLDALPVYRFNFKSDPDTTVDGFVAHEVSAHVPEAVTGEKDAMKTVVVQEAVEAQPATYYDEGDELPEGKAVGDEKTPAVEAVEEVTEEQPDYQGIDQSKLVPLLVAAVKELKAKVEALEGGE
jgi:hypothetical protein